MTGRALTRSAPVTRNQTILPALETSNTSASTGASGKKFGEMAGVTTAEFTAICCCCPLTVMDFLVLVFYKVPAGLCRKALRQRKRKRLLKKKKKQGLLTTESGTTTTSELEAEMKLMEETEKRGSGMDTAAATTEEVWEPFFSAGFGRSASQMGEETLREQQEQHH